jgi:hypothetical protein
VKEREVVLPEVAVRDLALGNEPGHVEVLALVRVDAPVENDADSQHHGQRHERGENSRREPTHAEAHHTAAQAPTARSPGPGLGFDRCVALWLYFPAAVTPRWLGRTPRRPTLNTMSREHSSDEAPANSPWGGPSQRGLKMRKRQDQGADLFRAALQQIDEPERLRHALLELSRTYNPVTNATLLPPEVRHRVLDLAGRGAGDEARELLEAVLARYLESGQPPQAPEGLRGA